MVCMGKRKVVSICSIGILEVFPHSTVMAGCTLVKVLFSSMFLVLLSAQIKGAFLGVIVFVYG